MLNHFSRVWLFATLWTIACQSPLSVKFSRQEYWGALPCLPPGDRLNPRVEPVPLSPTLAGWFFTTNTTSETITFNSGVLSIRTPYQYSVLLNLLTFVNSYKYFALIDLANMFYSVPTSTVSAVVCLYLQRDIVTFPGYLWGASVVLPQHKVLTTSTFLQEHRYEITLVASSSKKIHLTYSSFFDKRQILRCCYRGQIQTRISGP